MSSVAPVPFFTLSSRQQGREGGFFEILLPDRASTRPASNGVGGWGSTDIWMKLTADFLLQIFNLALQMLHLILRPKCTWGVQLPKGLLGGVPLWVGWFPRTDRA